MSDGLANGWIKCDGSVEQDVQLHVLFGSASPKIKGRILSAGLALMRIPSQSQFRAKKNVILFQRIVESTWTRLAH